MIAAASNGSTVIILLYVEDIIVDTGLTATITPKFSTSKVVILVSTNGLYNGNVASLGLKLAIVRNSTNVF